MMKMFEWLFRKIKAAEPESAEKAAEAELTEEPAEAETEPAEEPAEPELTEEPAETEPEPSEDTAEPELMEETSEAEPEPVKEMAEPELMEEISEAEPEPAEEAAEPELTEEPAQTEPEPAEETAEPEPGPPEEPAETGSVKAGDITEYEMDITVMETLLNEKKTGRGPKEMHQGGKGKGKKKKSLYDWTSGKKKKSEKKRTSDKPEVSRSEEVREPKTVTVRGLLLGRGFPAICVPLTGADREEILAQAERSVQVHADMVEWRADYYDFLEDAAESAGLLSEIRQIIGNRPLIFTLRSESEGGAWPFNPEMYEEILRRAADSEEVDLIDIEALRLETDTVSLCTYVRSMGKKVIASAHFFSGTPKKEELHRVFLREERMGADILKLAAMPQKPKDVLRLMQAGLQYHEESGAVMITMSMGEMGKISRVSGSLTGSAVTFGTAGQSSAPGQIPAEELRSVLQAL